MALNHVHLETVFHRETRARSWSVFVAYAVDDETDEIVAETFETYRNHHRPQKAYRKSRGQCRISKNKAPEVVIKEWRRLTGKREWSGRRELCYVLA